MGSKKVSYAIRCKGNTKISVAVNDFASVTVQHQFNITATPVDDHYLAFGGFKSRRINKGP